MSKVSVVIPIYNVSKYLRQCLDSVVNQTLKDIEIICVNDGSTDNSLEIIQEYAAKDSRIVIIDKKNSGYGDSMNQGFDKATGEYIGIIESDDYAELDMFETLYNEASKHNLDMIKSAFYFYYSIPTERNEKYDLVSPVMEKKVFCPRTDFKASMELVEFFNLKPSIWSAIYRKDFIRKNHIRFNNTPGASFQDTGFTFQVYSCAERVKLTNQAFLHYRQDNENSSVNSPGKVFCVCDEYDYIEKFLEQHPEFAEKLRYVKNRIKYDTYMWNYGRLNPRYKYIFIERAGLEFQNDMESGYISKEYFEWYKWNDLMELIQDPIAYHEKKMGVQVGGNARLEAVLNSKSYKIGRAITFVPRKLRGGCQCVKDHGLFYTIKLALKKIAKR